MITARRLGPLVSFIVACALLAASPANAAEWSQYRHDSLQSAANHTESELNSRNVQGVRLAWSRQIGGTPISYRDRLYTIGRGPLRGGGSETRAAVTSLRPGDGSTDWARRLRCTTSYGDWSAAAAGLVVVPTVGCGKPSIVGEDLQANGTLWAIDAIKGEVRWSHRPGRSTIGTPIISGDTVYLIYRLVSRDEGDLRVRGYALRAIDLRSGRKLWDRSLPKDFSEYSWVTADPDRVYVSDSSWGSAVAWRGFLYTEGNWLSLRASDGRKLVRRDCPIHVSYSGICAFERRSGELLWTSSELYNHAPAVANGVVYGTCACAVDASTGRLIWRNDLPPGTYRQGNFDDWPDMNPVVANGVSYFGVEDPDGPERIVGYDTSTGSLVADISVPSAPFIVVNGTIYSSGPTAYRLP